MTYQRLFEILYYLLNHSQVTAKQLADHFGVSIRTIYRDLDKLLVAGVPILTHPGIHGGIQLDEHYVLDKNMMNDQQQELLLTALQTFLMVYPGDEELFNLISALFQKKGQDWIEVHFDQWHESRIREVFDQIQQAIFKKQIVNIEYINSYGQQSHKRLFPMKLFFKGQSWYVQAYDSKKEEYRTYKLTRIQNLQLDDQCFDRNQLPIAPAITSYEEKMDMIDVVIKFQKDLGSFVYDEYMKDEIEEREDCYIVKTKMPYHQWTMSLLLSFGSGIEIMEPEFLRQQMYQEIIKVLKIYE